MAYVLRDVDIAYRISHIAALAGPGRLQPPASRQGAAEEIKRENDVHLRQLAKKSTYVLLFF
jgi:hypothetical protein